MPDPVVYALSMGGDAFKELVKAVGMMLNVEFVDEFAVGQANRHAVTRAANVDADAYRFVGSSVTPDMNRAMRKYHPHAASTYRATIN